MPQKFSLKFYRQYGFAGNSPNRYQQVAALRSLQLSPQVLE
jgi:hypothetical protein